MRTDVAVVMTFAGVVAGITMNATIPIEIPTFTLTEVTTEEQVVACGKSGGRGAVVYELDEFGNTEDDGTSFCVEAVK